MTERPTALIAEDETLMRERLKEKLAETWPELEIVAEASDGDEALALFDAHAPAIAFLDIRMPGRTGLDVAAAIGGDCHIVFITAYDRFAALLGFQPWRAWARRYAEEARDHVLSGA